MNNINTTVRAAIVAVTEDLNKGIYEKAKVLVARINSVQIGIDQRNETIADHQQSLVELAASKVDDSFLDDAPTGASKDTVLLVIKKMNEDRQKQVESSAKNLTAAIAHMQDQNTADEKAIAELRKQLLELQPAALTESQITGQ